MATITTTRDRLIACTGLNRVWVEGVLRSDREAGLLTNGSPGGGKGSVHYSAGEIAIVSMSLAALRPVEGPDAVRTLRGMPFRYQDNKPDDALPALPTFEDYMEHSLVAAGQARLNGAQWDDPTLAMLRTWELQLCLEPAHAIITVNTPKGITTIVYAHDPAPSPGVKRLTIISSEVLLALGELWAHTEVQRNAQRFLAAMSPLPDATGSDKDDAGDLLAEAPAS